LTAINDFRRLASPLLVVALCHGTVWSWHCGGSPSGATLPTCFVGVSAWFADVGSWLTPVPRRRQQRLE